MEYPGTRFTRPIRLTMLLLFIAAFFIISPILILYTAGYRYDWHNGLLKETGSISIDIEPADAAAFLNNIKLQKDLPIRLNNITPGKYNLRLTATGYTDWVKEIEVKNKQTNYIKEISLIKKTKPETIITDAVKNFSLSPDGSYLIYELANKNLPEIWIRNNQTKQTTRISWASFQSSTQFIWAKNNSFVAVVSDRAPYTNISIIDAANPEKQIDSLFNTLPITKINWSDTVEPQLYYSTENGIFIYAPVTKKNQLVIANTFIDWRMDNDQLWAVTADNKSKTYIITKDTLGFKSIAGTLDQQTFLPADKQGLSAHPLEILDAQADTILLKNTVDQKLILVHSNTNYQINADKFFISPYNNWWIIWSQWELWTYSAGDEPHLLSRSGEQLQQALPLDRYNTLALIWNERNTVLFPYFLVNHELTSAKIKHAQADSKNKILYFTTKDAGGIWSTSY